MTIDEARKGLIGYLGDMAALRPNIGTEDDADFVEAFTRARDRAKRAARDYVAALDGDRA